MATVTIIGSGMMGSALAFPARENGNEVRLVGTHLDREIIDECQKTNRHPKFAKHFPKGIPPFPEGCRFYQIEEMMEAVKGADLIIGGVSSFGVDWFGEEVLPKLPAEIRVVEEGTEVLFALVTVLLSCSRPGRLVSKVSPVEAAKYTEILPFLTTAVL